MAKFTAKFVREELEVALNVIPFEELVVEGNEEQTFNNVSSYLLAFGRALDVALIFEAKFPGGIMEIVEGYVAQWEATRKQLVALDPEKYTEWARNFAIYPAFDEPEEDTAFTELGLEPPVLEVEEEVKPAKRAKKEEAETEVDEDEEVIDEVEEEDEAEVDEEEIDEDELEAELEEALDEEFEDETLNDEAPKRGKK